MIWQLSSLFSSIAHANGTFMPPDGDTIAPLYDHLYLVMVLMSAIASLIVIGGMVYFSIKYRRQTGRKSAYITHNTTLEFLWSFIPFCLFMVAFGWGWYVYYQMRTMPEDAFEVNVLAQQWSWNFMYKSGKKTTADMYVPVNTPVRLIMTSKDVIHSMYIPAFRQKQDVVPGRYTQTWFQAPHVGNFHIFCAEYCGMGHSAMLGIVHVLSKADFDKWLETNPYKGLTPVQVGQHLFQQKCSVCHNPTTERKVGPGLQHVFGSMVQLQGQPPHLADENYIRTHILHPSTYSVQGFPKGVMPSFQGQLSEEELTGLIEYVKSLK